MAASSPSGSAMAMARASLAESTAADASWARLAGEAPENNRAIGAAEAEGVRQRDIDFHLACRVRHIVEIAVRTRIVEVDGRRNHTVADRKQREDRLDHASASPPAPGPSLGPSPSHLL